MSTMYAEKTTTVCNEEALLDMEELGFLQAEDTTHDIYGENSDYGFELDDFDVD
jgi:hypothetical protein